MLHIRGVAHYFSMIIPPSKVFAGSDIGAAEQWTEYLNTLSWAPGNRDQHTFNAFLRAGSLGIDPQAAHDDVSRRIQASGGTMSTSKIQSQLQRAYEHAGKSDSTAVVTIKQPKPTFDPGALKSFAEKAPGIDAEWLQSRSPVPLRDLTSASFLAHLYEPGEKVLVFTDLYCQGDHLFEVGAENKTLPKFTADGVWFLANPVDGKEYPNPRQENKPSRRSEESVTAFRYLVLESDVADQAQWMSALVQLPLQISAIYSSGGKSIHALVRVDAASKHEWDTMRDQMKPVLVALGADEAAMTAVRLTRLPGAYRGTRIQELLYLNPSPCAQPIIQQFP